METGKLKQDRRSRLTRRTLPLLTIAILAFAAGLAVGGGPSASVVAADEFATAWGSQDFTRMHELLAEDSKEQISEAELETAYLRAQDIATLKTVSSDDPLEPRSRDRGEAVPVPVTLVTLAFGTIETVLEIPYADGGIVWSERLVFPGLESGESLRSRTELPERAPILSRDQVPLAEGPAPARDSPLGTAALDVVGVVGEPDEDERERLESLGLPPDTPVGISGLERAFDRELAGTPGGRLLAVDPETESERVLAADSPTPGRPLLTTIDSELQVAAVDTLAGRYGGIAAVDARNGAVRALAGAAASTPQPPGSIYKVITTVAALERDVVSLDDEFDRVTGSDVAGRFIRNAGGEVCGGSFPETFARSCNSAFLPLGIELGSEAMIETAERFGFNSPPQLYNESTTERIEPAVSIIPDDLGGTEELAVTAIGQGRLMATPLQMASVAQAIAGNGVRMPTRIVQDRELGPSASPVRVTGPPVARAVRELMIEVVRDGTGSAAALEGIEVAGKTGTAELGPRPDQTDLGPDDEPEQMLNAWFIAFAPADDPRLAVSVMLVDAGADGGEVAAPAAAAVLAAALYE